MNLRKLPTKKPTIATAIGLSVTACLMFSSTLVAQPLDPLRQYSDQELANLPAPGPNPYLAYLPVGAEVDWNYWRQKAAYESRLRGELQAAERAANPEFVGPTVIAEEEPNDTIGTAQTIPNFGTGAGEVNRVSLTGNILAAGLDEDCFAFDLRPGDVVGTSTNGILTSTSLFNPAGELSVRSAVNLAAFYAPGSPLPSTGLVASDFVAHEVGTHHLCVAGVLGSYTTALEAYRPGLESSGGTQILFVDFDGATFDPVIFGELPGSVTLSPLSAFLSNWGLTASDENALIDAVLASLDETLSQDLAAASNPKFALQILNSRDHDDPFEQDDVSRLIVGGTINELGIGTIGLAQFIDPGNYGHEDTGVILLDLLSGPAADPNSLNQFGVGGGATKVALVAMGIANIAAHEAGHFLGNWHTEQFDETAAGIMDQGGNLANNVGVGADEVFGTADDVDVDFILDDFVGNEGFTGSQNTLEKTAFALTGQQLGEIFSDGFESGNTNGWTRANP